MSIERRLLELADETLRETRWKAEIRKIAEEVRMVEARIKRLEEAGDALYENSYPTRWDLQEANARKLKEQEAWLKAKEDKP